MVVDSCDCCTRSASRRSATRRSPQTTAAEAAHRLYERAGFVRWGTQRDALRYEGHVADEHHMALRIVSS